MDVLAPDVIMVSDGGGQIPAARHPIVGAEQLVAFLRKGLLGNVTGAPINLNGTPGARLTAFGELAAVAALTVRNGRITHIHSIRNPQKLARLDVEAPLTRYPSA